MNYSLSKHCKSPQHRSCVCFKFQDKVKLWERKKPREEKNPRKRKNEKMISTGSRLQSPRPQSSGSCSRWVELLGGGEGGGTERVRKVLGVLHQLIGISDVLQAEPEDSPHPVHKASITVLKVPGQTKTLGQRLLLFCSLSLCSSSLSHYILGRGCTSPGQLITHF